jgi:hypothetical protein
VFAHRAVLDHEVLQKVLVTEPERLLPLLTTQQDRPLRFITGYLVPFLEREEREGRVWPGLDLERAADYVARMLLSLIGSPGRWDLEDPEQVRLLVRGEVLAGVITPEALV